MEDELEIANQQIADYKKKAKKASDEFEKKICRERKNIEFSVIKTASLLLNDKELFIKELAKLPNSAIIYARDETLLDEAFKLLKFKANIHVKIYKRSKKKVLDDFNNGTLNYILSTESIKSTRENIRAVIFYGMPKHILKIYKEAMKIGRDQKRAKCIVLYNEDDLYFYENQLHEETFKQPSFFFELLDDMIEFCRSYICRRKNMYQLLGKNSNSSLRIPACETCCDNCQRFISNNAPPKLMFQGLDKHNKLNISMHMRTLLEVFNSNVEGFTEDESVKILMGTKIEQIQAIPIRSFGAGRPQDENYWTYVLNAAVTKKLLCSIRGKYQITRKGKKFIRLKRRRMKIKANPGLCQSLTRKRVIISIGKFSTNKWTTKVRDLKEFPTENFEIDSERTEKIWEPIFKYKPKPQSRLVKENKEDFDSLFEFNNAKPVLLRKRKLAAVENVEVAEEKKPKFDWREEFARAAAKKHPNQDKSLNSDLGSNEPGCSHWSLPSLPLSSSPSTATQQVSEKKLNDLSSKDCDDIDSWAADEEYCHAAEKIKPLQVPLIELLDYIESKVASDNE